MRDNDRLRIAVLEESVLELLDVNGELAQALELLLDGLDGLHERATSKARDALAKEAMLRVGLPGKPPTLET